MHALRWYMLSLVVVVLDHATKWLASARLDYGVPLVLAPGFDFTSLHNRGAAVRFLSAAGGCERWVLGGVAFVACGWVALWM